MCPHSPALSPRERAPDTALLLAAVLLRSGPQQLSATSSWPWSPFYLLTTLPAQKGGEERGLCPGHHRLPRGDSDKAGSVPVGAMWPRGAAATAQPKPCWSKAVPGAGLTPGADRRCCRGGMDAAAANQAQEGWGRCQGRSLHQRGAGLWGDLQQRHPCTGCHRSHQCRLCFPAAKKVVSPIHSGMLELPALWGVTSKAGLFCCAHGRSQAKLGPTATPQCPVPCLLSGPTLMGLC